MRAYRDEEEMPGWFAFVLDGISDFAKLSVVTASDPILGSIVRLPHCETVAIPMPILKVGEVEKGPAGFTCDSPTRARLG